MNRTAGRLAGALAILPVLGGLARAQEAPWGMPPGNSTYSAEIDGLYTLIFWITMVVFVGVEFLLLLFCVLYRRKPGGRPGYTHGNNVAETIWTIAPAVVLVFIAFTQLSTWRKAKMAEYFPKPGDPNVTHVQVMGERFKWAFRYAGDDGQFAKAEELEDSDDIITGVFYLPIGHKALLPLRSIDVIHSFAIPNMRVKQDAVPGLRNAVWFEPTGFYVAPVDPSDKPYRVDFRKNWNPQGRPYGPDWKYLRDEDQFRRELGTQTVAVTGFAYQDGRMRSMGRSEVKALRDGEVVRVPAGDVRFAIVPYEVMCMELCGGDHFTMATTMWVVPRAAYDEWVATQSAPDLRLIEQLYSKWMD